MSVLSVISGWWRGLRESKREAAQARTRKMEELVAEVQRAAERVRVLEEMDARLHEAIVRLKRLLHNERR